MKKVAHIVESRQTEQEFAVILADVIDSRTIEDFGNTRDVKLRELSIRHRREKRTLSPYTVTAWDEFQVLLQRADQLPRVLLDLRRSFFPIQLRIGVGFGNVVDVDRRPINQYAGGEAFERARKAADTLKQSHSKYRTITQFETGIPLFDQVANSVYHLADTLLEGLSEKQWRAIQAQMRFGSLSATANHLEIDISTLSRTLRRGHYWQVEETVQSMELIITEILQSEKARS
jgi:SatD family protein